MIVSVNAVLWMLAVISSVKSSLVTAGLGMQGRLLCAAVAPIALVSVTTVSSGLSAVAGPVHPGVRGSLDLLLHHDDLVLVLHAAAPVTVLTAARVVLGAKTLELDLNLVLGVAPVAGPAGAPADDDLPGPAAAPTHHQLACPAARPAAQTSLVTTTSTTTSNTSNILGFTIGLKTAASQPVDLVFSWFPAGTVISVPPLLSSLSLTAVTSAVTLVTIPITFITLPVRLVTVRFVTVRPVAIVLCFTFTPSTASTTSPLPSVPGGVTLPSSPVSDIWL